MRSWGSLHRHVVGAIKRKKDQSTQDYSDAWQPNPDGLPIVIAVADGHGSAAHPLSAVGAQFAVEQAIHQLRKAAENQAEAPVPEEVKRWFEEIIRAWREAVERHAQSRGDNGKSEDIHISYGTTLLAALITEQWTVCLQLGDGDIVTIDASGEIKSCTRDVQLDVNETHSLCDPFAAARLKPEIVRTPELLFLSTDGYSNSYDGEQLFHSVVRQYQGILLDHPLDLVESSIGGWLDEVSAGGSGDDIGIAVAWCTPVMPEQEAASPVSQSTDAVEESDDGQQAELASMAEVAEPQPSSVAPSLEQEMENQVSQSSLGSEGSNDEHPAEITPVSRVNEQAASSGASSLEQEAESRVLPSIPAPEGVSDGQPSEIESLSEEVGTEQSSLAHSQDTVPC